MATNKLYSDGDYLREVQEPDEPDNRESHYRTKFKRDYARLIHCASFRRLQGKTQIFPPQESDFFRNRLTHSLEVAQIARAIVAKLNAEHKFFKENPINADIVETAALAHDLGHPPFGHNGERALDESLKVAGGFEGNAQSFRIVSRLEKKRTRNPDFEIFGKDKTDDRIGLNWTYRSLAAIVKYSEEIPLNRDEGRGLIKGIYNSDFDLLKKIRTAVCPGLPQERKFKTIEASIMDVADDIAYSTYDLEDALKSGFMNILDILGATDTFYDIVTAKANKALSKQFGKDTKVDRSEIKASLYALLRDHIMKPPKSSSADIIADVPTDDIELYQGIRLYQVSKRLSDSGYLRTELTSELVRYCIKSIEVKVDEKYPALSEVHLNKDVAIQVEALKHLTFEIMTMSPRVRVVEARGFDVVSEIFERLSDSRGYLLMPSDCRHAWETFDNQHGKADNDKKRVIVDFIAGMTDRYALEFYGRLVSDNPVSMFKNF